MPKTIGQPIKRFEDQRLIRGAGQYVTDLKLQGMLYAKVLRSSYAHAKIKRIDVSRAKALPGVRAVLTGKDVAAISKPCQNLLESNVSEPIFPLAMNNVHFVGHEVVAVAATDPAIAEDALDLVEVEYEPLPVVLNPEDAMKDGAPAVREDVEGIKNNVNFHYKLEAGNVTEAFSKADHVFEETFETGRQHLAPMEPSAVVGYYDNSRNFLTVWATHQCLFYLRKNLSDMFGLPENRIRVVVADMGGGFGVRVSAYSHYFIPSLLSKITGAPVKMVLDRREDILASGHRNGCIAHVAMAVRSDGRILGLQGKIIWDTGAWHGLSAGSLSKGMLQMAGAYKIENVSLEGFCVYTNRSLTDACRGFGQPQAVFIRERMLDIVAKKMNLDPLDLRLRNVIKPEETPYRSSTGPLFDSPHFASALKLAAEAVGWEKIQRERTPNIGVGIALYQKNNSGYQSHGYGAKNLADYDSVRIEVEPDCSVEVYTGAIPQGQGHQTFMSQIVSEELGVDINKINVVYGDTDRTPYGMGTFGSRTAVISGGAIHMACNRIQENMKKVAAHLLEAREEDIESKDGRFFVKGSPNQGFNFEEIVKVFYLNPGMLPEGVDPTLSAIATYDPPGKVPFDINGRSQVASVYDIGAYAVVVKVDSETGEFRIIDQALAYDCGKQINPMIVEGQHHGALAHGIGMGIFESLEWNEEGQPLNSSFMDFLAPTAVDIPKSVKLIKLESHPIYQKWGYRGVGESGTIPAPAAIANAVSNALGKEIKSVPVAPEIVKRIVQAK